MLKAFKQGKIHARADDFSVFLGLVELSIGRHKIINRLDELRLETYGSLDSQVQQPDVEVKQPDVPEAKPEQAKSELGEEEEVKEEHEEEEDEEEDTEDNNNDEEDDYDYGECVIDE